MKRRTVITATVFGAAVAGALLMGGYEMNHPIPERPDCTPLGLLYEGGEDYAHGVWTDKATGDIVGFSATEDSTVYVNSECVEGQ